jgi:hypothetical protein
MTAKSGSYAQVQIVSSTRDQAEKQPERKDVHRKPALPHLTGAEVSNRAFYNIHNQSYNDNI